eukprot:ANDGO_07952.mRNA.1 hypothetical protein
MSVFDLGNELNDHPVLSSALFMILILCTIALELLIHSVDHVVNHKAPKHVKELVGQTYREIMILGIVSFGLVLFDAAGGNSVIDIHVIEFAHLTLFFLGIFYVCTIFIVSIMTSRRGTTIYGQAQSISLADAEHEWLSYREQFSKHHWVLYPFQRSWYKYLHSWYVYGMVLVRGYFLICQRDLVLVTFLQGLRHVDETMRRDEILDPEFNIADHRKTLRQSMARGCTESPGLSSEMATIVKDLHDVLESDPCTNPGAMPLTSNPSVNRVLSVFDFSRYLKKSMRASLIKVLHISAYAWMFIIAVFFMHFLRGISGNVVPGEEAALELYILAFGYTFMAVSFLMYAATRLAFSRYVTCLSGECTENQDLHARIASLSFGFQNSIGSCPLHMMKQTRTPASSADLKALLNLKSVTQIAKDRNFSERGDGLLQNIRNSCLRGRTSVDFFLFRSPMLYIILMQTATLLMCFYFSLFFLFIAVELFTLYFPLVAIILFVIAIFPPLFHVFFLLPRTVPMLSMLLSMHEFTNNKLLLSSWYPVRLKHALGRISTRRSVNLGMAPLAAVDARRFMTQPGNSPSATSSSSPSQSYALPALSPVSSGRRETVRFTSPVSTPPPPDRV